jgi:hypothetical protein
MNDEAFNMSIRRCLKVVGIRSQTELERDAALPASKRLTIQGVDLDIALDGEIRLE